MARPGKYDVHKSLSQLRFNRNITSSMLPSISFEPSLGISARRLDKLGIDIRSFKEPLKRSIKEVVAPSFRKNFDAGGRPAWEEHAEDTAEVKERLHKPSSGVLVSTGLLKRTITQLNIWTINNDSAIIMDVPDKISYGKVHQAGYTGSGSKKVRRSAKLNKAGQKVNFATFGGRSGSGSGESRRVPPIPQRMFVMLQDEDPKAIENVFAKWLEERIDKAWPRRG